MGGANNSNNNNNNNNNQINNTNNDSKERHAIELTLGKVTDYRTHTRTHFILFRDLLFLCLIFHCSFVRLFVLCC